MPYGKNWTWSKDDARKYVDELKGVTVAVNISIEGKQRILSLAQVEALLRKAKKIAISDCECRALVRGCDAPLDVCLYLDDGAVDQTKRGLGKEVTLEEALAALKRSNEAGLVLVAYTDRDERDPKYICSCCSCCCHSIIAMQRFGFNDAIISSDMMALQNDDLCDDCGLCVDRCHFKAREMTNGHLVFDKGRCFGCGVCVTTCSRDAISLVSRR